jgi:hypothetical protein
MAGQHVQNVLGEFNYKPNFVICSLCWKLFLPLAKWISISTLVWFPSHHLCAFDFQSMVQLGHEKLTLGLWLSIIYTLMMTRFMTIYFCNIVLDYTCKSFKIRIIPCLWITLCSQMAPPPIFKWRVPVLCFMFPIIN